MATAPNKEQTFNAYAKPLAKLFLFSLTTHHERAYAAQKHTSTTQRQSVLEQKTKIRFLSDA
jgi:hypothetical protein